MTKPNFTALALIVDESGSMAGVTNDTIGGINTFINDQKKDEGEATLTLVKFSNEHVFVHDYVNLKDVPGFTTKDYRPTGSTALYDTVAAVITKLGERFAALPEYERPSQVVVAILTDGEENASTTHRTPEKIAEMIKHQTEVYSWTFVFLAANQDAVLAAKAINIAQSNSMSYYSTPTGTGAAYKSLSNNVLRGRQAGRSVGASAASASFGFTEEDRVAYDNAATGPAPTQVPKQP